MLAKDDVVALLKANGFKQSGKATYAPKYEAPENPGDYVVTVHHSQSEERWWDELGNHVQTYANDVARLALLNDEHPESTADRIRHAEIVDDIESRLPYYCDLIARFGWTNGHSGHPRGA